MTRGADKILSDVRWFVLIAAKATGTAVRSCGIISACHIHHHPRLVWKLVCVVGTSFHINTHHDPSMTIMHNLLL